MKILFELEDRVRKDSTCVYFKKAFERIADVTTIYPENLYMVRPGLFDLHIRVDYGIDRPFAVDLKPSVYYAIDTHIDPDWRVAMAKEADFDYIFCAQKLGTKLDWHTDKVFWLPLACDPEVHCIPNKMQKIHDICFVGSVQPSWQYKRVQRLDKLFKQFPNFYFGNKYFREITKKYAESRIVFNSAHSTDINMRVFEAMCSGSFLLTDKQEWHDLFVPGVHFDDYTDKDMIDKVIFYLYDEEKRERIAEAGKKLVLEKHTYEHRAKEILKICGFC